MFPDSWIKKLVTLIAPKRKSYLAFEVSPDPLLAEGGAPSIKGGFLSRYDGGTLLASFDQLKALLGCPEKQLIISCGLVECY
jgi:hypothetical protein